jgi:hypothetical protein
MWDVWETREVHTGFWWGKVRERYNLGDLSICGKIIIKLILRKWYGEEGMDWITQAQNRERVAGFCECDNEP